MGVESPSMAQHLAAVLLAAALVGLGSATPVAPLPDADSRVSQSLAALPQSGEADRKFAEIIKLGRQSEQIKLVPQLQQFIRDYPDYPRIETVYATLLSALMRAKTEPERLQALADETLARFTGDQSVRWTAYHVKFSVLAPSSPAFRALGRHILDTETSVLVLNNAAEVDKPDALPLLEKAIAEQTKHPRTGLGVPPLDELRWAYARALIGTGRTEEGLKSSTELLDDGARRLEALERTAGDGFQQAQVDSLREVLADRCGELVPRFVAAGKADVALRYLKLQQRAAEPLLDRRPDLLATAAEMYEKLGRPDLALNGFVRAMATRMDPSTRDQIVRLAWKTGKNPDDFYRRAKEIRTHDAKPAYPFALVTSEGQPMKLADLKARAVLVSFFYPT